MQARPYKHLLNALFGKNGWMQDTKNIYLTQLKLDKLKNVNKWGAYVQEKKERKIKNRGLRAII